LSMLTSLAPYPFVCILTTCVVAGGALTLVTLSLSPHRRIRFVGRLAVVDGLAVAGGVTLSPL
jgi:hypothetical protein